MCDTHTHVDLLRTQVAAFMPVVVVDVVVLLKSLTLASLLLLLLLPAAVAFCQLTRTGAKV